MLTRAVHEPFGTAISAIRYPNKLKLTLHRAEFLLPSPAIPFDRNAAQSARAVARQLIPDPKARRRALEWLRDAILRAHQIDGASWGVTLAPKRIRFNVGRGSRLTIAPGALEWKGSEPAKIESETDVRAPADWLHGVEAEAGEFEGAWFSNPAWRQAHSPGVLKFLEEEFGQPMPTPDYATQISATDETSPWKTTLQNAITNADLRLDADYLATFFTALQLKGFAVTSGLSGTGKTRLATTFAALLPQPGASEQQATLDENFAVNGRLYLPASAARLLSGARATITCDGAAHGAKIENGALTLRGAARKCAQKLFDQNAPIGVESEIDDAGRVNFRLLELSPAEAPSNHLFVPVRPDWSDGKALLGYFNPLLSRYEWTPFLRFILRADAGFRQNDGVAYFVILDEMNLARAEHYFADLLSILESGRDNLGRTREPLRFEFDARASGDLPPRELFLPPNLYFVGTLNADETTYALSPKVLDRAWMLQAPPVDFCDYPPKLTAPDDAATASVAASARSELNRVFTRDGSFAREDKSLVARELEAQPRWRDDLQILNEQLQQHDAGFGYRVFDEIVAFCALARQSDAFESVEIAFDFAVCAKIIPRFGGARGSVEAPLQITLDWARERDLSNATNALQTRMAKLEREGWL